MYYNLLCKFIYGKTQILKTLTWLGLTSTAFYTNLWKDSLPVKPIALISIWRMDEDYWSSIRNQYKLKPDYINLENGFYCFAQTHFR